MICVAAEFTWAPGMYNLFSEKRGTLPSPPPLPPTPLPLTVFSTSVQYTEVLLLTAVFIVMCNVMIARILPESQEDGNTLLLIA